MRCSTFLRTYLCLPKDSDPLVLSFGETAWTSHLSQALSRGSVLDRQICKHSKSRICTWRGRQLGKALLRWLVLSSVHPHAWSHLSSSSAGSATVPLTQFSAHLAHLPALRRFKQSRWRGLRLLKVMMLATVLQTFEKYKNIETSLLKHRILLSST